MICCLQITLNQTTNFGLVQIERKEFADDNFKFDEKWWNFFQKGGKHYAHFEQVLLFPQYFQKINTADLIKHGFVYSSGKGQIGQI